MNIGEETTKMQAEILLIDQQPDTYALIKQKVHNEGYDLFHANSIIQAHDIIEKNKLNIIILDIELEIKSGHKLCKQLKDKSNASIIIAANAKRSDVLNCMTHGADDFILKPIDPEELLIRINILLNRKNINKVFTPEIFIDKTLVIDLKRSYVAQNGSKSFLTPTETKLLKILLTNRGKVLSHKELIKQIWGTSAVPIDVKRKGILALYIKYLREKIENDPRAPDYIHTHWGIGYSFDG